jgi:hypothetical protein
LLAYDPEGRLHAVVSRGLDYDTEVEAGFSTSIAERVLFTAEPLYLPDASAETEWQASRSVRALGLRTVIGLPFGTPNEILGVLYLDRQSLDPLLTPEDMGLLTAFAGVAASALVRERAREAAEATAHRQRLALDLVRRLSGLSPQDRRLAVLDAAREAVDAERAFWLRPAGDGWQALAASGAKFEPGMVSRHLADAVAESGEAIGLLDVSAAADWAQHTSIQALGLRTVWCLPTEDGGLLYLDTAVIRQALPEKQLSILKEMLSVVTGLLPGS